MAIRFENDYTKQWLAQKGPAKVFGKDVDTRERLKDDEAVEWFDRIWDSSLQQAVEKASPCNIDFVRSKVPHYAQSFISEECNRPSAVCDPVSWARERVRGNERTAFLPS